MNSIFGASLSGSIKLETFIRLNNPSFEHEEEINKNRNKKKKFFFNNEER